MPRKTRWEQAGSEWRVCPHEPHWRDEAWSAWALGNEVICPWGRCSESFCPECGCMTGNGYGAMACPCDTLPSWHRKHREQRHKPHPPIKAAGRHRDRIINSRRIHAKAEQYYAEINHLLNGMPA